MKFSKRPEGQEGKVAKAIERRTSQVPSDTFLWMALGSMAGSAILQALGKRNQSQFVGQWAPTLLILGVYNKLVKVAGSERSAQSLAPETAEEEARSGYAA